MLSPLGEGYQLVTAPGPMGEDLARESGFNPHVVGTLPPGPTSAGDTRRAAQLMLELLVDLLLFAGGDGTARDIYAALGGAPGAATLPVLGIPAGVKIHSAVFAAHPRGAGEIAAAFLRGERVRLRESEVVDLDEDAYRQGLVSTRLYGYLSVPYLAGLLQNRKAPTPASEEASQQAIAAHVVEGMQPGWQYILGPGTTTRAVARQLGFPKTLVGVDIYTKDAVVVLDVSERRLLDLLEKLPARIVVTPIGGQGFIFGRGNQQISPPVIRRAGRENILVVCTFEKLNALRGEPLRLDTGDLALDESLAGYLPVVTGYREQVVYRVGD
jgi:predicted polyphosphate/ATP-dependent NAD kinase